MMHDSTEEARKRQTRMVIENKLRAEKQRVLEKQRLIQSIQRDVEHMNILLHRKEGELARAIAEVTEEKRKTQQETQMIKKVDFEMRDLQNTLMRIQDDENRIQREIADLQRHIEEKHHQLEELKRERANLSKAREEHRQKFELGSFHSQQEQGVIHDKEMVVGRIREEIERIQREKFSKDREVQSIQQEIMRIDQEIMHLENELRQLG